jgi:excisionase family DNA binding protein
VREDACTRRRVLVGFPCAGRVKHAPPRAGSVPVPSPGANHGSKKSSETSHPQGEPPGARTRDPRLKRTGPLVAPGGRASQAVATTRQARSDDSTRRQGLAGFPLSFAAPLLTVREVAAFLWVSTRTVYKLCDEGRLAHVRIGNAIRVERAAVIALLRDVAR